jgi:hypothetical protein
LTDRKTRESFGGMRTRFCAAALAAAAALVLAAVPAGTAAPSDETRTADDAAAKRCKNGRARYKGRCVRRCPQGYAKRRRRGVRRCVRLPGGNNQGGGPGLPAPPPGSSGPFERPSGELSGQAAFDHFKRYFLNSRFTDCPGGWPSCAVEERYDHCENGAWAYHRYTPTSGSDINSYGSYQVTGAAAHPDGSWSVEYVVSAYGNQSFYSWDVAANGRVVGRYWAPGTAPPSPPSQQLGPLGWQQPADCS